MTDYISTLQINYVSTGEGLEIGTIISRTEQNRLFISISESSTMYRQVHDILL